MIILYLNCEFIMLFFSKMDLIKECVSFHKINSIFFDNDVIFALFDDLEFLRINRWNLNHLLFQFYKLNLFREILRFFEFFLVTRTAIIWCIYSVNLTNGWCKPALSTGIGHYTLTHVVRFLSWLVKHVNHHIS